MNQAKELLLRAEQCNLKIINNKKIKHVPIFCDVFTHKTFKIGFNSKTIHFKTNRSFKMNPNECQVTLVKTFLNQMQLHRIVYDHLCSRPYGEL